MGIRHPLGIGADPTKNHHTPENRRAVGYCLTLYWTDPDALADRTTDPTGDSQVGLPLAGRFVTRVELSQALAKMQVERSDLIIPLHLVYARGMTREAAAALLHLAEETLRERLADALDWLIDELFVDSR